MEQARFAAFAFTPTRERRSIAADAAPPPPRAALQLLDLQIRANAIERLAMGVLAEHAPALVRTLRMLGYTKATSALTSIRKFGKILIDVVTITTFRQNCRHFGRHYNAL
jgi:hypothetical protein